MEQFCARWGCNKSATYDKPLCYEHWLEWEAWELEECNRCHWFYFADSGVVYDESGWDNEFPFLCDDCLWMTLVEAGRRPPWDGTPGKTKPAAPARTDLARTVRYIYIVKLDAGEFYVGQTTNLRIRMQEHADGTQQQTRGKNLRLVYYEQYEGERDLINQRENELTVLNQHGAGRRRLREMIERFQEPLRLLNLEV